MRSLGIATMLAGAAVTAPAMASPSDVNAQAFYANAQAVQARGMAAMFDKRLKPMVKQIEDAGARARAANEAATSRGEPLYCVPPAAKKKGLSSKQVIAMLGRMPEGERRVNTLQKAWLTVLTREYPC
ncbi:hypothetical protein GCM10011371_32090 [Novosphingobium marinum]|nr:hypothetical protein GCM10011371_32090 [Novosphingobium marinum]